MSLRTVAVVMLAIVFGACAAIGVTQLRPPVQGDAVMETTSVLVAAVDIGRGRMITLEDVKVCQWPKQIVPEGALSKPEDAVDRAAAMPLLCGEPVFHAKLLPKDAGRGLAALIPKGMRAYAIQTTRVASSVAGFVLPGNRVDILMNLRGKQDDTTGGGSTTTLLESVEILAVDQRLDAPSDNKVNPKELSSVTLLVKPEQASLLDLGQSLGQLTLSLRNPEDANVAAARPATLADLRMRQDQAPAASPIAVVAKSNSAYGRPDVYQIVTIRGTHRGVVSITAAR